MNRRTDFVIEIIRAASEVDRLGNTERRRLIDRVEAAIRDMREAIGLDGPRAAKDSTYSAADRLRSNFRWPGP